MEDMELDFSTPVELEQPELELIVDDSPTEDVVEEKVEPVEESKPWKKSEAVPYERFKEVNEKQKAATREVETLRARIEELERSKVSEKESFKPTGDDELDSDLAIAHEYNLKVPDIDQYDDLKKYESDRLKFTTKLADIKAELKFNSLREQERINLETERINNTFMSRVESVKEVIPDINEAINYISTYSRAFDPEIQREIAEHPHGPELLYAIAQDKALIASMINDKDNPFFNKRNAFRFIDNFKSSIGEVVKEEIAPVKTVSVPKQIKGSSVAKSIEQASSYEEYKRLVRQKK